MWILTSTPARNQKRSHFISKTIKVLELELWNLEHIWGSGGAVRLVAVGLFDTSYRTTNTTGKIPPTSVRGPS